MEERHLSLSEAADALNISERTTYRWIKSGKLRAYKPGRDYWIPESAVKEVVKQSVVRPKVGAPSSQEKLFNNGLLEEERRAKLEEARRDVQYIIGRAERYEQELEGERAHWYNRTSRAGEAYVLAVRAIDEFSSFHRFFFNEVARDLVREIENGNAPELVDEFDSLEETFMERIGRTQRMLLDNANGLAEAQDQRDDLARLRKAGDANVKSRRHSASA